VNRCPAVHGVTKPFPLAPFPLLLVVGWHRAGSRGQLTATQASEGCGAGMSSTSPAGKAGCSRGDLAHVNSSTLETNSSG